MEMEPLGDGRIAREEVVDALAVQAARAADQAVDLVVGLAQEQLGEIRPVLAGDSRDQCTSHGGWLSLLRGVGRSGNVIGGELGRQDRFERLDQLPRELLQCLAVGIVVAGVEHLDGHRRAARRPARDCSAGDRQAPDVVLQLALTEDVVPESHMLDQFTSL